MKKLIKLISIAAVIILTVVYLSFLVREDSVNNGESIDLNEPTTKVRIISFDEMVEEIAYHKNRPTESIRNHFIENKKAELSTTDDSQILSILRSTSYIAVNVGGFPTLEKTYKPTGLLFYGEGNLTDNDKYVMSKILHIAFDGSNAIGTGSKAFNGNVYVNLEAQDIIYYSVNGDFYNNEITNYDGWVEITMNNPESALLRVSSSSVPFSYIYHTGRWHGSH